LLRQQLAGVLNALDVQNVVLGVWQFVERAFQQTSVRWVVTDQQDMPTDIL
jgi:hypothetical protein